MKFAHIIVIGVMVIIGVLTFRDMTKPYVHDLTFEAQGRTAIVRGSTDSRSSNLLSNFLRENPTIKTLILQDMPGTQDMNTNRRIVMGIRAQGLRTHVPADGYIASGAVDWFIAGSPRTIACGAMIGVHSWSTAVGDRADKTFFDNQKATQRHFLSRMNVDPDFYEFTRDAAGPDGIHWLTVDEMLHFRLLDKDPQCED